MSGGHFEYKDFILIEFADQLALDIKASDTVNEGKYTGEEWDKPTNFEFPETKKILGQMIEDLTVLRDLLHEYDWAICGDTCEETFIERAKKLTANLPRYAFLDK